jgi:hypothetical protein
MWNSNETETLKSISMLKSDGLIKIGTLLKQRKITPYEDGVNIYQIFCWVHDGVECYLIDGGYPQPVTLHLTELVEITTAAKEKISIDLLPLKEPKLCP